MKNNCGPEPHDLVERALWCFANIANWGHLHPADDNRFYEFVVLALQDEKVWQREDVEGKLREYKLPERHIKSLGERFWAARCALVKRERMQSDNHDIVY
jgi:hypothetical protein